jgi:hypothetical protein
VLDELAVEDVLINEVIEIELDDGIVVIFALKML